MIVRKTLEICLLSLAAMLSAMAQDTNEQRVLKVDFSVFPLEPSDWKGILYAPSGDPTKRTEELRFNPHERTLGFRYNGPSPLRFYREFIDEEGTKTYQSVGQVNPGAGAFRDTMILFFQPESESSSYKVHYMFDSPSNFPDEALVFFNTTDATFEGILGDNRISLKPGASDPIDVREYFDEPAPIGLVIQQGDKLHKVLMNKIRFSPDRRTLMILRKPSSPTSKRIRTQRLTEYTGPRNDPDDPGA